MTFYCIVSYPNSVKPGYLDYQIFDSIQGLCSYLRGVVSTSAVLTAAGVGDGDATALSAAVVSIYMNHGFIVYFYVSSEQLIISNHTN